MDEVFTNVKDLFYIAGGICGVIGITRIYQKWSNGNKTIDADIITWLAGAFVLLVGAISADAMFN